MHKIKNTANTHGSSNFDIAIDIDFNTDTGCPNISPNKYMANMLA